MAAVVSEDGAETVIGTAGAVITKGQALYLDPLTNTFLLAKATTTTGPPLVLGSVQANLTGIALCSCNLAESVIVQVSGDLFTGNGDVLVGVAYQVSSNAGGVVAVTSSAAGWFMGLVGHGLDTSTLRLSISGPGSTAKA